MAAVAALRVAERLTAEDIVVVLLPDGGRGYLGKIFNDDWMADYGFLSDTGGSGTTVGDVLRGKRGDAPALIHVHPYETVREAIDILREYSVSQMPVVKAEPPVTAGEVVGSVSEKELLDLLFAGHAHLADPLERHMSPPLPIVGAGEPVAAATAALEKSDALLVHDEGKPAGVLTRQDLLGHLAAG
jgi:cystathionine beta-synthase